MLILRKEKQLIIHCMKRSAVTVICNFISCTEAKVHSEFHTSEKEMENLYSCLDFDELYSDPLCSVKVLKLIHEYNPIIPDYQFHSLLKFQNCVDKGLENMGEYFLMAGIVRFPTFLILPVYRLSFLLGTTSRNCK